MRLETFDLHDSTNSILGSSLVPLATILHDYLYEGLSAEELSARYPPNVPEGQDHLLFIWRRHNLSEIYVVLALYWRDPAQELLPPPSEPIPALADPARRAVLAERTKAAEQSARLRDSDASPPQELVDYFQLIAPLDIRLRGHRIGIETVFDEYLDHNLSAEEIVNKYHTLTLEKVCATLAYYWYYQPQCLAYLRSGREEMARLRAEARMMPHPNRLMLEARLAARRAQEAVVAETVSS